MRNEKLRVLRALAQRRRPYEKNAKGRRTRSESITLSLWARLSVLARSPLPLAVRASCAAVKLVSREARARAMASTRLASDVTSFWTTVAGSRRQLSQCPQGVLSLAHEKSVEEKCLLSLSVSIHDFCFSGQHVLCEHQFSALFQIQAKLDHVVGLFAPCVSQ